MAIKITGIDCAVQSHKVGIAIASYELGKCRILSALRCDARRPPSEAVKAWHDKSPISLIALDAPLGWPEDLSTALSDHSAGFHISNSANKLFQRETDREIYQRLGKKPLDVGANFIARTAKAALDFLQEMRSLTGESIPLAWQMEAPEVLSAIEVYPAATLRSSGLPIVDYKKLPQVDGRRQIIDALPDWLNVSEVKESMLNSPDVLDAVLCVLAAVEFVNGNCVPPSNSRIAKKEGWIWAGKRKDA